MDSSLPGFSIHGISQARILEWVVISFSRGSSDPGMEPMSPALASGFSITGPSGKSQPHFQSFFFFFLKVYFGIKIAKTNKEKPTPGFPVGKDLDLVEGRLRITNKPISGLRGLRTDGPAKGARLILPKLWVQRPGIQALNRSFCVLTLTC